MHRLELLSLLAKHLTKDIYDEAEKLVDEIQTDAYLDGEANG